MEDHTHLLLNDELDELQSPNLLTHNLIWNVEDLIKSYLIAPSCFEVELPYSAKFWWREILTDADSSNIWRKIFWWMVTVFHYTPVNAKQFDGLNIDSLARKHQKRQNFPLYGSRWLQLVSRYID